MLPGVEYRLKFTCADDTCPTEHDMSILDWGAYVLSRKVFAKSGAAKAERDVVAHIESCLDLAKRDSYLFLGNSPAHPRSFMVVGLFYPPRVHVVHAEPSPQLSLLP